MSLASIERLVRDRIGLDLASIGAATLPRAVECRMAALGLNSTEVYTEVLLGESSEWSALVGDLVVPETWFHRGGADFYEHLARCLRTRLNDSPNGRTLRILSVPCSTGEEPYSLALALDQEGVPAARYRIDGVDLARDHLLRAIAGRYSAFAFREPSHDPRPKHFREVEDGKWELLAPHRNRVHFRPGNLVDPNFLVAEPPYDLILCRNLFIYLTAEGRSRAHANLDRLLAPDGWLCLTAAEADRLPAGQYIADGPVSLAIFKRASGEPPRSGLLRFTSAKPPSGTQPPQQPRSGATAAAATVRSLDTSTLSTFQPVPSLVETPVPRESLFHPLQESRRLADAGNLDAARSLCERALGESTPSAGLHSLLGVIHLASGRSDEATDAFRKALYLDPDQPEALTHMIVLSEKLGDPGQAANFRRRLERVEKGAAL